MVCVVLPSKGNSKSPKNGFGGREVNPALLDKTNYYSFSLSSPRGIRLTLQWRFYFVVLFKNETIAYDLSLGVTPYSGLNLKRRIRAPKG